MKIIRDSLELSKLMLICLEFSAPIVFVTDLKKVFFSTLVSLSIQ